MSDAIDQVAKRLTQLEVTVGETTLDDIARRIDHLEADLSQLKEAVQAGFKDGEVLREDFHRRFDASERKHFEQISLLKAVIRTNLTNR